MSISAEKSITQTRTKMFLVLLSTKEKQTHRQREETVVAKGEGWLGGMEWEFGISRGKLSHIEWINN